VSTLAAVCPVLTFILAALILHKLSKGGGGVTASSCVHVGPFGAHRPDSDIECAACLDATDQGLRVSC